MDTFLNAINTTKVNQLLSETDINVQYFNNACNKVVLSYSEPLDNLMKDLYFECVKNKDTSVEKLEEYYLELSNMIYFMIEKLEQLGVYSDMAESASKEVYSKNYLASSGLKDAQGKSKSTVAELQAKATEASQYESVVSSIYDRAYSILKGKINAAQDMMNTLRRILSTKTEEMKLSQYTPGSFGSRSDGND